MCCGVHRSRGLTECLKSLYEFMPRYACVRHPFLYFCQKQIIFVPGVHSTSDNLVHSKNNHNMQTQLLTYHQINSKCLTFCTEPDTLLLASQTGSSVPQKTSLKMFENKAYPFYRYIQVVPETHTSLFTTEKIQNQNPKINTLNPIP